MWHPCVAIRGLRRDNPQDMTDGSVPLSSSTLHLLGRFSELYTGAERELLDLKQLVAGRRPVRLWSDVPVHPGYADEGISAIQPFAHQFPKDGTLLIGGSHLQPGVWLKYTRFERIIVLHNISNQRQLFAVIEGVREFTGLEPELVFVSGLLQRSAALPGRVIPSLLNLAPFLRVAAARLDGSPQRHAARPFTVGRVSRDFLDKHHPHDLSLYRMLAGRGMRVRIMGGTCLAPGLAGVEGIELLPAGAEPVPDFYASLDAVFYRTGKFVEAYGRVVLEAMGAGLPVVAHELGGYAEVIEHGASGFLVRTQEEAFDALLALENSGELRSRTGHAARQQAIEVHGPAATECHMAFYLRQTVGVRAP
jgi:glycosyltransferase involved in cell wall biosynthesis